MSVNKCDKVLDCGCSEFPFRNLSAEAPDPATFFAFDFERITPPLGAPDSWWGTTVGREPCESTVSQQEADDCARRGAETDIWNTWRSGGVRIPIFGNRQTQCFFQCPDTNQPSIYTVLAGTVIAPTQEEADSIAASLCEYRGRREKKCGPLATTLDASNITSNATLNGTVNPNNATTNWYFEWGNTTAYGNQTPTQALPASGSTSNVSAVINGFGQTTHFRLVATNANGTSFGADKTFQAAILPPQAWWKMEESGDARNVGNGRVDIIGGRIWAGPAVGPFPAGNGSVDRGPGKVNNGFQVIIVNSNSSSAGSVLVPYNGSVMDITAWVRLDSITGSKRYTIFEMTWSSFNPPPDIWELRYRSDTNAFDMIYGITNVIISPPMFSLGAWHFLRISFDGLNLRMGVQIDNGPVLSGALPGGFNNPPASLNNLLQYSCQDQSGGPGSINASWDEFAIWDRILTQPELDILYNNGNGVTWPIV